MKGNFSLPVVTVSAVVRVVTALKGWQIYKCTFNHCKMLTLGSVPNPIEKAFSYIESNSHSLIYIF